MKYPLVLSVLMVGLLFGCTSEDPQVKKETYEVKGGGSDRFNKFDIDLPYKNQTLPCIYIEKPGGYGYSNAIDCDWRGIK